MRFPIIPALLPVSIIMLACTASALTPIEPTVDLTTRPGIVPIASLNPAFSWKFSTCDSGTMQSAFQIQVATATVKFRAGKPDLWDSGKVDGSKSMGVRYEGAALPPDRNICWRVRVWDETGTIGPWSETLSFRTAPRMMSYAALRYPQEQKHQMPVRLFTNSLGRVVIDFGNISWGWAELLPPMSTKGGDFKFVFSTDIDPKGSALDSKGTFHVRVRGAITTPGIYRIPFMEDPANTLRGKHGSAALAPEIGVIRPFRYIEVEACPYRMTRNRIRKIAISYPLDRKSAAFVCDWPELEKVWKFSKNSLESATFAGVFVDGERQRIANEMNAWMQQAGHCALYGDYTLQRFSQAYLRKRPSESPFGIPFAVMMAYRDYQYTGDRRFIPFCYQTFKEHLLKIPTSAEGLFIVEANASNPVTPDENFVEDSISSPFNAAIYKAFVCMSRLAAVEGFDDDQKLFAQKAEKLRQLFFKTFFKDNRGCFVDGVSTSHASLIANTFALAFGLVPEEEKDRVAGFCISRGMDTGLFGSQLLLEALMESGFDTEAVLLMVRNEKRSWLELEKNFGNTATDHWTIEESTGDIGSALASAPANIIPRYLLGVTPLEPGFGKISIKPQIGPLLAVEGIVPTARGRVSIGVRRIPHHEYRLTVDVPPNTLAEISVPVCGAAVFLDDEEIPASPSNGRYAISGVKPGKHTIVVKE